MQEPRVKSAMTAFPYAIDVTATISAALVTHHGRLAGIFTATDACRVFATCLEERFRPPDAIA